LFKSGILAVFFYNIFLWLYVTGVRIAAVWNSKAKKWLKGRKGIFNDIRSAIDPTSGVIWIHCSSLGEFEQGRPVIEKLKELRPNSKFLVTFFSPSGYEVKKNYAGADHIFYLPMDSRNNAKSFLDLVNPSLAIFIKYDYWYFYLSEIRKRKTNCLLISAVFRNDQFFFKWYGSLHRTMLRCFTKIFVQDAESKALLETISINHATISGDTRFDTVSDIAQKFERIPAIENFIGTARCIVAGSTWKEDEEMLQKAFLELSDNDIKLIIAPHEIHPASLNNVKKHFPESVRFSELSGVAQQRASAVLIMDNIGMLSRLYKYGDIAYVGGGFTRDGVHNVLEAAVYAKPVVFGRNYKKYQEAIDLLDHEGAKTFSDSEELYQILSTLLNDEDDYRLKCQASRTYVEKNVGATQKILNYIEENRLLTS